MLEISASAQCGGERRHAAVPFLPDTYIMPDNVIQICMYVPLLPRVVVPAQVVGTPHRTPLAAVSGANRPLGPSPTRDKLSRPAHSSHRVPRQVEGPPEALRP